MSSPSVGAHLRRLREGRGVSLDEIARATRVSSSYLHALESDDFASLPVPVFTRGFIRAYCQTLGEAAEPALELYDARSEPTPAVADARPPVSARAARMAAASEPTPKNRGPLLVSFVLLVFLGIALFAVTLILQSGRDPDRARPGVPPTPPTASGQGPASATGPAAATPTVAAPATAAPFPSRAEAPASAGPSSAPAHSASSSVPSSSAPPATAPSAITPPAATPSPAGGHRLIARTSEPTWMRVRTEDGRVSEETIPAGQVREWQSDGPFRITVGNAGGVRLELNGRAMPPLGASGVVVPNLVLPERP